MGLCRKGYENWLYMAWMTQGNKQPQKLHNAQEEWLEGPVWIIVSNVRTLITGELRKFRGTNLLCMLVAAESTLDLQSSRHPGISDGISTKGVLCVSCPYTPVPTALCTGLLQTFWESWALRRNSSLLLGDAWHGLDRRLTKSAELGPMLSLLRLSESYISLSDKASMSWIRSLSSGALAVRGWP